MKRDELVTFALFGVLIVPLSPYVMDFVRNPEPTWQAALPPLLFVLLCCDLYMLCRGKPTLAMQLYALVTGSLPGMGGADSTTVRVQSADEARALVANLRAGRLDAVTLLTFQPGDVDTRIPGLFCERLRRGLFTKLLQLDMSGQAKALGPQGGRELGMSLAGAPQLQVLQLQGCALGDAGGAAVAAALPGLPQLKVLGLSANALGSKTAAALAEHLSGELQQLYLAGNPGLGKGDAAAGLAGALGRALPALLVLEQGGCNLAEDAAAALAEALPGMPLLKALDLRENRVGTVGASAICGALAAGACPGLHSLSLAGNALGNHGALAVAAALPRLPVLYSLHLAGAAVGPGGAVAIAEALSHVPELRVLDLSDCPVKDAGARALAEAMPPLLQSLSVARAELGREGVTALAACATSDSRLRHLWLEGNLSASVEADREAAELVRDAVGGGQCKVAV